MAKRPAQPHGQSGIEKRSEGDKSPLLSRLIPLKALIFAHPAIFGAAMRVENHVNTSGNFARRSIRHDPNSSSYRTEITPEGFTTYHLESQQTWPKPKLKLGFSEETTPDGVKIRHYEYQKVAPDPDCELAEWSPVEVSSEHQETWDARPNTWRASYAVFADLVRSGQLAIWARWNSRRAPLERVAPDLWPKQPADECIDFKSACIIFPDGEKLLTIQIEVADETSEKAAAEDTSEKPAIKPKTGRAQAQFKQFVTETISSSPNAVTKKRGELIEIGIEMGVAESAAKKIRKEVIAELSLKNPIISEVWTAPGRHPTNGRKNR